jgi:acetyl/propionyl-CoA carboxylase alpha subunit
VSGEQLISRLLVANRGEIARRIFVSCRQAGIGCVAVFSDPDAAAPHVREADAAVRLPGASPADTYLNGPAIVAAAIAAGADAVHPGYGFLAEDAGFARAVLAAGLTWVGPPPDAIEAMASKITAKKLAAGAGVPVLPVLDPAAIGSLPDPGSTPDSGPLPDPSSTPDSGPLPDPGSAADSGSLPDPGSAPDSGPLPDPSSTCHPDVTSGPASISGSGAGGWSRDPAGHVPAPASDLAGSAGVFPVLVKASGGGGGRGMRVVRDAAELPAAIEAARREAQAAFGDPAVFCEPLLPGARHVEVQVIADAHGTVWALTERDCSVQRRYQKVIEETPSPAVGSRLRGELLAAATAITRTVGYRNAGTAEFLVTVDGQFFFLEFNTRLQVEHPVTECVHGIDLVALQLDIAQGLPLPPQPPAATGHAIEARLYAEDPAAGYLPASGIMHRLNIPGVDVRFSLPPATTRPPDWTRSLAWASPSPSTGASASTSASASTGASASTAASASTGASASTAPSAPATAPATNAEALGGAAVEDAVWTGPSGVAFLRLDAGIESGSEISPHYDPMLAKVIAWAPSRQAAARRLASALERARIHGPATNRALLVSVLREPRFGAGQADTELLDDYDLAGLGPSSAAVRLSAVAAALADVALAQASAPVLASLPPGWRNVRSQPLRRSFDGPAGRIDVGYVCTRDGIKIASVGGPQDSGPEHNRPERGTPEYGGPEHRGPEHDSPAPGPPDHGGPEHRGPEHDSPAPGPPDHGGPEHRGPELGNPAPGTPDYQDQRLDLIPRVVVSTADQVVLEVSGVQLRFDIGRAGGVVWVDSGLGAVALTPVGQLPIPAAPAVGGSLIAPMPGTLVRVQTAIGAPVRAGQPVLILEAMKMEHQILAPADGVLAELRVEPGAQVNAGDVLAIVTRDTADTANTGERR